MPEAGGYCSTVRGSFPKASKSNPGRQHPRVTSLLARAMKEDFTGTDKTNDHGNHTSLLERGLGCSSALGGSSLSARDGL